MTRAGRVVLLPPVRTWPAGLPHFPPPVELTLMSKPTTIRQAPLALTDQQLNIVRLHARLVPTALRGRYLDHIARNLAVLISIRDADVERAAARAGMRFGVSL